MLTIFRSAFAALVSLKIVQLIFLLVANGGRGILVEPGGIPETVLALATGAIAIAAMYGVAVGKFVRLSIVVASCGLLFLSYVLGQLANHTYLIVIVFAILFIGKKVSFLLKVQLSILYFYAAITKINETYLAGNEIYISMVQRPAWQTMIGTEPPAAFLIFLAVGSIVIEGFLVFGLWFRKTKWIALIVGVCFHIGMFILITDGLERFINLVVYGGLALSLYLPFFSGEIEKLLAKQRPHRGNAVHA